MAACWLLLPRRPEGGRCPLGTAAPLEEDDHHADDGLPPSPAVPHRLTGRLSANGSMSSSPSNVNLSSCSTFTSLWTVRT